MKKKYFLIAFVIVLLSWTKDNSYSLIHKSLLPNESINIPLVKVSDNTYEAAGLKFTGVNNNPVTIPDGQLYDGSFDVTTITPSGGLSFNVYPPYFDISGNYAGGLKDIGYAIYYVQGVSFTWKYSLVYSRSTPSHLVIKSGN